MLFLPHEIVPVWQTMEKLFTAVFQTPVAPEQPVTGRELSGKGIVHEFGG